MPKKFYSSRRRTRPKALSDDRKFPSEVKFPIKLQDNPNGVTEYNIPISRLFNPATVGNDKDLKLVGYTLLFIAGTGNNIDTVGLNLSHAGPWVRRGPEDNFNQQFNKLRTFRDRRVYFSKKKLPTDESNYLNPHTDGPDTKSTCRIVLKVEDILGVLKGDSLVCSARAIFLMPHTPTLVEGADTLAGDLYQAQLVSSAPAGREAVLPLHIFIDNASTSDFTTLSTSSPFKYTDPTIGGTITILTTDPSTRFSGTANFPDRSQINDRLYSPQGYSGTVSYA